MFIDVVFPDRNEKKFAAIAASLETQSVCMAYKSAGRLEEERAKAAGDEFGLQIIIGSMARTKAAQVLLAESEAPRPLLQNGKVDLIFGLESSPKRDYYYQKRSGLDEVAARKAAEKRVLIGLPFASLLSPKRAEIMARMAQNILLLRKYKCQTVIASFARHPMEMRSAHDLRHLYQYLGMSAGEAKAAINGISNYLEERKIIR